MDTETPVQPEKKKRRPALRGKARKIAAAKVQALDEMGTKTADIAEFFGVSVSTINNLKKIKAEDVEQFKQLTLKHFVKQDFEIAELAANKMREKLERDDNKLWEITSAYKTVRELQRDKKDAGSGNLVVNIQADGGVSFIAKEPKSVVDGVIVGE